MNFNQKPIDASFAPQYIFLRKSICIMSQIPLHSSLFPCFWLKNLITSGKETVVEPLGTLPRAQEPLRIQSEARNRNDSPAWY